MKLIIQIKFKLYCCCSCYFFVKIINKFLLGKKLKKKFWIFEFWYVLSEISPTNRNWKSENMYELHVMRIYIMNSRQREIFYIIDSTDIKIFLLFIGIDWKNRVDKVVYKINYIVDSQPYRETLPVTWATMSKTSLSTFDAFCYPQKTFNWNSHKFSTQSTQPSPIN